MWGCGVEGKEKNAYSVLDVQGSLSVGCSSTVWAHDFGDCDGGDGILFGEFSEVFLVVGWVVLKLNHAL